MYWNLALFFLFATQVACNVPIGNMTNRYMVSGRELFAKKLRKIAKVVKTGIKIAAIANPAGLKALLLSKAKELAIKKGLQCLKNGLSNFCNGKNKLGKFSSISKVKGLVKKRLSKLKGKISIKDLVKGKVSKVKAKANSNAKGRLSKAKSKAKGRLSKAKSKTKGRVSKIKGKVSKFKGRVSKVKDRVSKVKGKVSKVKELFKKLNCNNVFDGIAERINNATNRIIENPVNKGRDWLKKKIGGNTNCPKSSSKPVKKHLRTKPIPSNDDSIAKPKPKPKPVVTNDDSIPKPKPLPTNDDSIPKPKPKYKPSPVIRKKSKPRANNTPIKPIKTNDDSIATPKPRPKHVINNNDASITKPKTKPKFKPRAKTVVNNNDDSTPNPSQIRPSISRRKPPLNNDDEIATIPPKRSRTSPRLIPTPRPKTTLVNVIVSTIKPSLQPSWKPSLQPSSKPSLQPSFKPSLKPSWKPSLQPSLKPSLNPTIPYMSWDVFSSAPVILRPSSFPTLVPTTPLFNIITNSPTEKPSTNIKIQTQI